MSLTEKKLYFHFWNSLFSGIAQKWSSSLQHFNNLLWGTKAGKKHGFEELFSCWVELLCVSAISAEKAWLVCQPENSNWFLLADFYFSSPSTNEWNLWSSLEFSPHGDNISGIHRAYVACLQVECHFTGQYSFGANFGAHGYWSPVTPATAFGLLGSYIGAIQVHK